MKTLGVIGGLGPMATAYFMQLVTQMSEAENDQQHMELLVYSKPSIPDRTGYILGRSAQNPLPALQDAGRLLKRMGARMLAVPCITAHYFQEELERETGIPVIHTIRETAAFLKRSGVESAGILATEGTVRSRIFQAELEKNGIRAVLPDEMGQRVLTELIYGQLKKGSRPGMDRFLQVSGRLRQNGAQITVLACTELSLIKRDEKLGAGYLDALEVLAQTGVRRCGRLKQEYEKLITY